VVNNWQIQLYTHWQFVLLGALLLLFLFPRNYKPRHVFNRWVAKKHLARLKSISNTAQKFGFLRGVNPYIFEEMVLTSFERAGCKVKRSTRYSGDGGKDGEVKVAGRWHYVQSKRYQSHIKVQHVAVFRALCEKHKVCGVFVHCGRTSKGSWSALGNDVAMISGNKLMRLLVEHRMPL
jgi:restriction system protein